MSRSPRGFCAGAAFQNRLISCAGLSTWGFKFDVGGLGVASFLGNVAAGLFDQQMCSPRQSQANCPTPGEPGFCVARPASERPYDAEILGEDERKGGFQPVAVVIRESLGQQHLAAFLDRRSEEHSHVGRFRRVAFQNIVPRPRNDHTGAKFRPFLELTSRAKDVQPDEMEPKPRKVARPGGFEPPTYRFVVCRSIQLS